MADITTKNQLKQWFVTGSKPNQTQYYAWMDSYWHKQEQISINNIAGLGDALANKADTEQLQYYAAKDAGNIDVNTWKTKLGVGSLPSNVATIDDGQNTGNTYSKIQADGLFYKKVADPNDGNVYILKVDGSLVNANTFGKNVTNSSNTTSGSFTQTQRAGDIWYWNTAGQEFGFKNLPDKSADASFVDFVGKNSNGQVAKVGYPALNNLVSGLTAQQALNISQLLNGSVGGGGEMSVNLISPPIIQNRFNTVEYILLRGANLNLNPTAMSIQILAADKATVAATIPNNQVQLNSNGLELVFYYNFYNFPTGTYFLKITSGVKSYITTLDLKVVQSITNIDTSTITWDKVYAPGVTPSNSDVALQNSATMNMPTGGGNLVDIYGSYKSSAIFNQGEDFYLELTITYSQTNGNTDDNSNPLRIGIGYSNSTNSLQFLSQVYAAYAKGNFNAVTILNNTVTAAFNANVPDTRTVTIIKTGNLFRTIIGSTNHSITLSNNSNYSIFVQSNFRLTAATINVQITKAFKIN